MIVRASKLFLPTLREDPADAEAVSHKLLVRGGVIRQLSAGVWTFLPLGWRVHQRIVQIIRKEMDAIGAQEMLAPVLTPAELWEASGRIRYPEVFKLRDRNDRRFVLPMTHEETFTFHAREIQSYRELPQFWYHFGTKERDEPRPRGGLIRVREFIMKDSYSFDRDDAGLEESFQRHAAAYRRIFDRCGLDYYEVEAERQRSFRPAEEDEIRRMFGAGGGSIGPVGVSLEVVADEALREGQFVAGANRDGWHLRGVEAGRDFEPRFADIREVGEGDRCPNCGGALRLQVALEVGHIFKLGTRFPQALGATFLDEDGQERPIVMGSYGIGPGRVMAAIVEQHHDELGIRWPASVAPYDVHVVALPGAEEIAERAAERLDASGKSVLLDDRDARAGEKFADADLIGRPLRVTAGRKSLEDGAGDVRGRAAGEEDRGGAGEGVEGAE